MEVELTPAQLELQHRARTLAREELAPKARQWDETETFPMENFKRLAEEGLTGLLTPQEYGGAGFGCLEMAIVLEELATGCVSTADTLHNHITIGQLPLVGHGTEEQRRRYLVPAALGKTTNAFALTEPQAGSDAANITTTAEIRDDTYVINGLKQFVTLSGVADATYVAATTAGPGEKSGISLLIVDKDTPGFTLGERVRLMGQRGLDTGMLHFENCVVPQQNLLGREGHGLRVCLEAINAARVGAAAMSIGIARRALEESVSYSKGRVAFGKPIAELQGIQFMIAEAATDITAARLLAYKAARAIDAGQRAIEEVAMAKLFATTMVRKHTLNAIDIHGGQGYSRNVIVERLHRDSILFGIGGGTGQVMKLTIAKQVLDRM